MFLHPDIKFALVVRSLVNKVAFGHPEAKLGQQLNLKKPLRRLQLIAISVAFFVTSPCHAHQPVEIVADLRLLSFKLGTNTEPIVTLDRHITITCVVGNGSWRIDNDFSDTAVTRWQFDGTNVYESTRITNPPSASTIASVAKLGFHAAPFEVTSNYVTVAIEPSSEGCPLGNVGVNIPWLAYCSGPYLKSAAHIIPLPISQARSQPDTFAYQDKLQCFRDELGLPQRVELETSKHLFETSLSRFKDRRFAGDKQVAALRRGFAEDGVRVFEYNVNRTTNFLGLNFPLEFEYHQKEFTSRYGWVRRYGGVAMLKSIRSTVEPEGIFEQGRNQVIEDGRFHDDLREIDVIVYDWTNAFVSDTNDPVLRQRFLKELAGAQTRPLNPQSQHALKATVVVCVIALTLLPLGVFFFRVKHLTNRKIADKLKL